MWITGKGILLTHLCPLNHPMKTPVAPHLLPGGPDGQPFLAPQQHDHPKRPQVLFVHNPEMLEKDQDSGTALLQIYNQNYEQFRLDAESTDT